MEPFARLHPITILCYYVLSLVLVIALGHPLLFLLLFFSMFVNYGRLYGLKKGIRSFFYSVGAALACVVINPLLNHRGVTVLTRLGDWQITREAVCYGFYMAFVLLATLFLFSCFRYYMTSEKLLTLLGNRFPSFALLFSMILRLVPKVQTDFREMTALHGNRPGVWSALTGKLMEDSMERSMAMRQKGYGTETRTSWHRERLHGRDILFFLVMAGMTGYVLWRLLAEPVAVQFYPSVRIGSLSLPEWTVWLLYMNIPLWMWAKEVCVWNLSRRRITASATRSR